MMVTVFIIFLALLVLFLVSHDIRADHREAKLWDDWKKNHPGCDCDE